MKNSTTNNKGAKKSRRYLKLGHAPGTVTYYGNRKNATIVLSLFSYSNENYHSKEIKQIQELKNLFLSPKQTHWLNLVGLNDEMLIKELGLFFKLNSLSLEAAIDTLQRPKIDDFGHYIFGVFKMVYLGANNQMQYEHLAIVLLEHTVIVFQEVEDDVFNGVRNRLVQTQSRIRGKGADYLFFALLDAIVDHYFIALEFLGIKLQDLEQKVYESPQALQAQQIQELRKEILKLRQNLYPTRDLVQRLMDSKHPLIGSETKVFLRDLLNHTTEINETLQLYRELSSNLMELHLSAMSHKMNEVMKVLTIMASIFIPLTFIVGVYGMNFSYMPELHWRHGYTMVWIIMGICFIAMIYYFKRKKWL